MFEEKDIDRFDIDMNGDADPNKDGKYVLYEDMLGVIDLIREGYENKVSELEDEISHLNSEVVSLDRKICDLEEEIDSLKDEIADLM